MNGQMSPDEVLRMVQFGSVVAEGLVDMAARIKNALTSSGVEMTEEEMDAKIDEVISNSERRKKLAEADARGENS